MQNKIISTNKDTTPREGYNTITHVRDRGVLCVYRLYDKMTSLMNSGELTEFYETEKQKGNPHPASSALTWAIFEAAVRTKDEELLRKIQNGLKRYSNTLTKVVYPPEGSDRVVHNYGTLDEYSLEGNVVGSSGWVSDLKSEDKRVLELILGTKDIRRINRVSNLINGTDSFLNRLNSKHTVESEKVVGFHTHFSRFSGWFDVDCDAFFLCDGPAFRVLKVE